MYQTKQLKQITMKNLKVTNEDFLNYVQSLSANQVKALNYALAEVKPMKISTQINGDSYKANLVRVERKGKTIIVEKFGEEEVYTFRKGAYRKKGYKFGGVNFNKHEDYRVSEI